MLGKSTIKAINFTRPIKAIETIVAPIIKVPVSPGKIFAGYLLKYRKAIKAPSILILIIVTSYFPKIIQDIVKEVTYLNEEGNLITLPNEKCDFSYRHSYFSSHFGIITQVLLQLPYGKEEEIKNQMEEYAKSRREKQPLAYPSAGSTFKRGTDFITAKLIDECGLKGYTVGKAQVSNLHAGFVVNLGGATAKDVLAVIEHVKQEVLFKTGKQIELEIKLLGEF